ncbi:FkbM family methyltransferase [Flavobacteriaceae bacterium]|nr:FkbM family methyltransferase [Flavobacteriaceae bacterium]
MKKKILNKIRGISYEIQGRLFRTSKIKMKNGLALKLITKNSHEVHRAKTFYSKEPEMIEWINRLSMNNIDESFVFYDIGANIGVYSLYTAILHKNSLVYSFEPQATNFSSLCQNIVNNDLKNMIPLQLAFSNAEKFDMLNVGIVKSGAGAASIEAEDLGMSISLLQGVYCISLDSIYENKFFKKPNYIKIDVDGHESIILENAVKILTDKNLKGIIIEYEYSGVTEMDLFISKICSYGFKLTLKSEWIEINTTNNKEVRNFLFER